MFQEEIPQIFTTKLDHEFQEDKELVHLRHKHTITRNIQMAKRMVPKNTFQGENKEFLKEDNIINRRVRHHTTVDKQIIEEVFQ